MKHSEPQKNAFQLLNEFDRLGNLQASPEWDEELSAKLRNTKHVYQKRNNRLKFAAVVACFGLINAAFFLRFSAPETGKTEQRSEVLQSISAGLLINPTALK